MCKRLSMPLAHIRAHGVRSTQYIRWDSPIFMDDEDSPVVLGKAAGSSFHRNIHHLSLFAVATASFSPTQSAQYLPTTSTYLPISCRINVMLSLPRITPALHLCHLPWVRRGRILAKVESMKRKKWNRERDPPWWRSRSMLSYTQFPVIVDYILHRWVRTGAGASPKNIYIKRINFIFDAGAV